jgi:hypothetical protein
MTGYFLSPPLRLLDSAPPGLPDLYPSASWGYADTQVTRPRLALAVYGPADVLAALAGDWRFPALPGYPYSVADYRAALIAAIDLHTLALMAQGFTWGGGTFALDQGSLPIWQGMLTATQANLLTYPVPVGTVDHQLVNLTGAADVSGFYAAGIGRAQAILIKGAQLKAQIAAAQTVAALDAVTDTRT